MDYFSWLSLITLHSSSAISLTQLSMNPKHSWLLDGHDVIADRKLNRVKMKGNKILNVGESNESC